MCWCVLTMRLAGGAAAHPDAVLLQEQMYQTQTQPSIRSGPQVSI